MDLLKTIFHMVRGLKPTKTAVVMKETLRTESVVAMALPL